MKLFCAALVCGLLTITATASHLPKTLARPDSQVKTDPQVVSKLAQILEKSGYPYKKAADNVWVIAFKGRSMADISLLVTSVENLIIVGAVVAPKNAMKVGPEMMFKVLRLVHDIDRVKIGFDNDEDLFVRAEIDSKCFEVEDFKAVVDQVSVGADKIHAAVKSYLVK